MILLLLILSISSFILYFYIIWLWYLWFIPLLVFLIFIIYYISGVSFKSRVNSLFQDYGLFFAWIVILFWLFLILKFFGIDTTSSILSILSLNILFWFGSYIFKYEDWKLISQLWYYFSILFLVIYFLWNYWFYNSFGIFSYMRLLTLAIVWFLIFIFSIYYDIERYLNYKFLILVLWSFGILLYNQIENIYIFLIVSVFALSFLYVYIYRILIHKPPTENQIKEISVRRILAWERVLKNINQDSVLSKKIYAFVQEFPKFVKYWLEFANTLIILILIYLYFKNALSIQWNIEQLFYWLVMVWFVINVYFLKRINYTSILQRLLTFLVINFAIYISLFSAFDGDIWSIVFLWIIRNIMSTMMVFHIHKTKIWEYLRKIDYLFWIFTTMLALAVNIVLLFHTNLVWWLLFPVILLYIGIQGMALYYSIKYINKIKEIVVDEEI